VTQKVITSQSAVLNSNAFSDQAVEIGGTPITVYANLDPNLRSALVSFEFFNQHPGIPNVRPLGTLTYTVTYNQENGVPLQQTLEMPPKVLAQSLIATVPAVKSIVVGVTSTDPLDNGIIVRFSLDALASSFVYDPTTSVPSNCSARIVKLPSSCRSSPRKPQQQQKHKKKHQSHCGCMHDHHHRKVKSL
jgi:hypothetical protein